MIIIRVKNGGFVSDHKKLNIKKNNAKTQIFFSRSLRLVILSLKILYYGNVKTTLFIL